MNSHSAREVERTRRGQPLEAWVEADGEVVAHQRLRPQRQARFLRMRFRQAQPRHQQQHHRERGEEPEDHRPRAPAQDPAADDRRDGRGDAEDHRYLAHQALRVLALQHIADHRTTDDQTDAGGQPLQRAESEQRGQVLRQRAADRSEREDDQAADDHALAPDRVRQRPVHQAHQGIGDEIRADGLLDRDLVRTQPRAHHRERRENGVDRERSEHRQAAQQQGEAAKGQAGCGGVVHGFLFFIASAAADAAMALQITAVRRHSRGRGFSL